MTTIKSYTDLSQSKTLSKILKPESADMIFQLGEDMFADSIRVPLTKEHWEQMIPDINPCWSLAALISVLPSSIKDSIGMVYALNMSKDYIEYSNPNLSSLCSVYIHTCGNDNLVDACYEMIIKLHELNLF